MSRFLADNVHLISFINGLAFFVLGLSLALERGRESELALGRHLRLLSGYGFMACLANWLRMVMVTLVPDTPSSASFFLHTARLLSMVLAAAFLLRFATTLIADIDPRYRWLRWGLSALGVPYVLVVMLFLAAPDALPTDWISSADVYARYLLLFPGLALSALALWGQHRDLVRAGLPHIAGDSRAAALAFGLKAIASGLIAHPVFASSLSSSAAALLAVRGARTLSTVVIACFVVRVLRFFEAERRQQLAMATERQLQAQQQAMQAQQKVHAEVERWSRRLEDLVNSIAAAMSRSTELEEVLRVSLGKVLELTGFEAGHICLTEGDDQALRLMTHSGLSISAHECRVCLRPARELRGSIHSPEETVVVPNPRDVPSLAGSPCHESEFQMLVSVPVSNRGKLLGIMHLLSLSELAPEAHELGVLSAIGVQIGVAIENARMQAQMQSVAASEERDWIGRELHDGLAQVLGYLRLKCKEMQELLSSGQMAVAEAELEGIQEVVRQAYADVRESILGLRTTITPSTGLVPALTEYLHKFSQQSGISARLVTDDSADTDFAPTAEIQLLRIVQEALTNIRKHSQARTVWVRFEAAESETVITIMDDGRGFELSRAGQDGQEHYGLQTMRERAESVGGTLQISTQPGQGTRVSVRLPYNDRGGD